MRRFGQIRQLGFVAPDGRAAAQYWSRALGVGPFFETGEITLEDFRYLGAPAEAPTIKQYLARSAELSIEIIEQTNTAPSAYLDFLAQKREGLQHLGSLFPTSREYDESYRSAVADGATVLQEGRVGKARFAYFATHEDRRDGLCFEITEGGSPELRPLQLGMQRAAHDWDGCRPIRPVSSLS